MDCNGVYWKVRSFFFLFVAQLCSGPSKNDPWDVCGPRRGLVRSWISLVVIQVYLSKHSMGLVYFPAFYHMKLTIHVGKYTIYIECVGITLDFFPSSPDTPFMTPRKTPWKQVGFDIPWNPRILRERCFFLPGSSWANVDLPFAAANGWLGAKRNKLCGQLGFCLFTVILLMLQKPGVH